jgi:transposase
VSQIQALDREQPVLPMMPGVPERRTHSYVRHGTTSLFAALDVASGFVIGKCYKRHRAAEFLNFLKEIDAQVPEGLDIHIVMDNYATHKTPKACGVGERAYSCAPYPSRLVWCADSFEGLPAPDPKKYPLDKDVTWHLSPMLAVSLEQVRKF